MKKAAPRKHVNRRLLPPTINAAAAGVMAIQQYDANKDGKISGEELTKCPSLNALAAKHNGAVTAEDIADSIKAWQRTKIARAAYRCTIKHNGKPLDGAVVTYAAEKFLQTDIPPGSGRTGDDGSAEISVPLSCAGRAAGDFFRVLSRPNHEERREYSCEVQHGNEPWHHG